MSIGIRIKQARKKRGMSCKELATLVGVTPSAITNYENGISFPKPQVLCALFGALKVDANFLFQDYLFAWMKHLNQPIQNQTFHIFHLLHRYF